MSADVLAVRLDSDGDVLLTGPAVRALARGAAARGGSVDVLASPAGTAAARLLPGVRDVVCRRGNGQRLAPRSGGVHSRRSPSVWPVFSSTTTPARSAHEGEYADSLACASG